MSKKASYPVNLPKTDFDMRAGLVQKEPKMIEKWESMNLYQKRLANRNSTKRFIFHDGPPYANGDIHIGTALNKILKDVICRYKYMEGFQVPFTPGWDCHGLPIEMNTLKSLGKSVDSLSPVEIRQKSREYAQNFVEKQKDSFKRLGVTADWENPYLTMSNDYEASIIEAFGKLVGNGYIYRGQRPIYWSPDSRTALADAEVEYHEHTSPTVYVLFPIVNNTDLKLPEKSYVMIWTTTPWTLPANVAVAFQADAMYEAVTLDSGITVVVAAELKTQILALTDAKEVSGRLLTLHEIESLKVSHPWIDRESKVVFADYVTLDTGTGVVHTAPGHGTDDYQTGLKYNLDILSPVDDEGRYTEEVPEWKGLKVFDANPKIIEFLQEKGLLYFTTKITHSYPHDWRTKTPVIFRTKPQWFFKVSDLELNRKALASLPTVKWMPAWGEDRLRNMLSDRPDWCVSRQRKWGVPIPAFYCGHCHEAIVTEDLTMMIAKKVREEGLNFWLENSAEEILPKDFVCPHCANKEFTKEEDILDVWFDSGTSHYAVLEKQNMWPADLYFEGNDQYRGWFQASLWNSIGITGQAPFKAVLTHGWVLDENGRQMHKSAGNSVSPSEVTEKFGADILRLWTITEDYTKDLRIGDNLIQKTVDWYRKIRNTYRYLLGSLFDFKFEDRLSYADLTELDKYMLHKLGILKHSYKNYMDQYQFHRAYREIMNFIIIDLSGEYFDILKDRLYISSANDKGRRSAQTVLSYMLEELMLLFSPVLVFTTEEVYQFLPCENKVESVHLLENTEVPLEWINEKLAKDFDILNMIREESMKELQLLRDSGKIGSSLEGSVTISCPKNCYDTVLEYQETLLDFLIVSEVIVELSEKDELVVKADSAEKAGKIKCERCWKIQNNVNNGLCVRCTGIVAEH